jgi:hypothetical protein
MRHRRRRLAAALAALTALVGGVTAGHAPPSSARSGRATAPAAPLAAQGNYISTHGGAGRFPLAVAGHAAAITVDKGDYPGVVRVAGDLRGDIAHVSDARPALHQVAGSRPRPARNLVVLGTVGHSRLVDSLVRRGRLDVSGIRGKWETTLEQVVGHPFPGVRRAFVIAGSDQRGTIYGAYDVSRRIGVSPWTWWDDVTPAHHHALYVLPGPHTQGTPVVKYRGFFINDENPALGEWAPRKFGAGLAPGYPGGFNHRFYAKVFEVALRLKANYIWPAVWGRAFAQDDPRNQATASRYGIVMGTSHEAPMMRGIEEWNRHVTPAVRDSSGNIVTPGQDPYGGTGEWSFRYNAPALKKYWAKGIRRMVHEHAEGVVTLGMRGPGDVSLPDGDGIDLMKHIIKAQRAIIVHETGKPADRTPQVWTLYKEVQRYWDEGMRPPKDVTVVFTDDNWGNIRQLPDQSLPPRPGGYGLYYHFDYVGGGRDYKWVDTASLQNTWDELHQAYSYGDSRLWMANVGDMKNNEEPLQFFLDYAWNPHAIPLDGIHDWLGEYAAENFGTAPSSSIADVLNSYGHLQSRRKPELLNRKITVDPDKDLSTDPSAVVYDDQASPYNLTDYRELDRVTDAWQRLAGQAAAIGRRLPADKQDAYYELVGYEVEATANLYAMRRAEFTNLLYAQQGRAATNHLAQLARKRFATDQAMSRYYNRALAGGKWRRFQSQPHIDYGDVARYGPTASWQEPERNDVAIPDVLFPHVRTITLPDRADMAVAIDGSDQVWPDSTDDAVLPEFSPYQSQPRQYLDVFNRGSKPFRYRVVPSVPWVHASPARGKITDQRRVTLSVDWAQVPDGTTQVPVQVVAPGQQTVTVTAVIQHPTTVPVSGFVEANGYVSMDAAHYTRAVNSDGITWTRIPSIARTGAAVEPFPVTADPITPGPSTPRLEYRFTTFHGGPVNVLAYLSPRNDVLAHGGLRYAVSIDGEQPKIVNIATATGADDSTMNRQWERNTSDNTNLTTTVHQLAGAGTHTLSIWMVDPTVVVQKLVIDTGGLLPSYLGPPESTRA